MRKREFVFNIKIGVALFACSVMATSLHELEFIRDDLFVQVVLAGFFIFTLFRVVAPYFFTKMDPHGTPEMQRKIRSNVFGRFFIIED